MKVVRLLFILMLCNVLCSKAQSISGIVLTVQNKPATDANVILLTAKDSAVVQANVADKNGAFVFESLKPAGYILKISATGYELYFSSVITLDDKAIQLPATILTEKNTSLKEVSVVSQKPYIEVHADKLVVNVENSIVSAGSSVLDVVSHSPGVRVDQDDNISLKGKPGVTIMIDGRIQAVSGQDLANMLKSMPSSTIEKVEIISNPSSRYDAAGISGIINIKTKKDAKYGVNGSIKGSYAQGVYPKASAGVNMNYRDKKWLVYAGYNASNRMGMQETDFARTFYNNGSFVTGYRQHNYTIAHNNANVVTAAADYNISANSSIGISCNIYGLYKSTSGTYYSKVLDENDVLQSTFITDNRTEGRYKNIAPNLHYKHSFDTAGTELTVDADYIAYSNHGYQDFTTNYYAADGSVLQPDYLLHGDLGGKTVIRSIKADFVHPMKHDLRLEAGIKTSLVTSDNEPMFFNMSNGKPEYDSSKSDHFIYNENINAAYVNANKDWKKWGAQIGLRAEQTIVDGDEKVTGQSFRKSYLQLFPTLGLISHLNVDNDLNFTLSRRITRPGYDDLNPYKFFVDPNTFKVGNPYLNPSLAYSAEFSHIYKQRLVTGLGYTLTKDAIVVVVQPNPAQAKASIQTTVNLKRMHFFSLNGSYTIPVFKWWNNVSNFNVYYSRYVGDLANTHLDKGQPSYYVYTLNSFTLTKGFSAEMSFDYGSAEVYGFLNKKPSWGLNAGVQKTLLNKQATIKLNATDIFHHNVYSASSTFTDYSQQFVTAFDTRQLSIEMTYRFGKKTVSPVRTHKGGAEDEKQRAGA